MLENRLGGRGVELIWLGIWTGDWILWTRQSTLRIHKIRGIPRMNNDSFYKRTAPSGSLPMDGSNPLTQVKVFQLTTDKTPLQMMVPLSPVRLRTSSRKAQIMNLLIMQSSPVPHYLVLLRPIYTRTNTCERDQLCMPHTCRAILTTHYVTTIKDFSLGCYKAYDALAR
jgi:hypothetical protein